MKLNKVSLVCMPICTANTSLVQGSKTTSTKSPPPQSSCPSWRTPWPNTVTNSCGWIVHSKPLRYYRLPRAASVAREKTGSLKLFSRLPLQPQACELRLVFSRGSSSSLLPPALPSHQDYISLHMLCCANCGVHLPDRLPAHPRITN